MSYKEFTDRPGMRALNEAKDFDYTDSWVIEDGNIRWVGYQGGQESAFTKEDFGSFRLFVTMRITETVTPNSTHLAVMIWGKRPAEGTYGSKGFVSIIPPNTWMWDYRRDCWIYAQKRYEHNLAQEEWHEVEILTDIKRGHIRTAVDGLETIDYFYQHDLRDLVAGPIAFQQHWDGIPEYKDIYIEVDPKDADKLLTVKE
ncbi:MAG: DUF1080 domain-containing protein [Christensenellaceae bacterium]|nr:DUF1080 domain-containing protein [Christensenellaceae bacterium]